MTDSTARKKVPLPPGYVVPRPQQPPPMRRRDSKSVTGVEVVAGAAPEPKPVTPTVASAPSPVRSESADERALQAVAYREAMATLSEDEDKTTAFQVPEELLRRSRTGVPALALDEEQAPDSGAITAPPPPSPIDEGMETVVELKLGVPGVPRNLDVHSFADAGLEDDGSEERSGEFTRINTAGELEMLAAMVEQESTKTKTVVRKRLEVKAAERSSVNAVSVLWMVIGALSAAGAVLASLMASS